MTSETSRVFHGPNHLQWAFPSIFSTQTGSDIHSSPWKMMAPIEIDGLPTLKIRWIFPWRTVNVI